MSEKEYHALPIQEFATYPVYFPSREPPGYWEKLQKLTPQPLIDYSKPKTEADWVNAVRRNARGRDQIFRFPVVFRRRSSILPEQRRSF